VRTIRQNWGIAARVLSCAALFTGLLVMLSGCFGGVVHFGLDFEGAPTAGPAPLVVQFTSNLGSHETCEWAFGDGGTSTERNPTHTYSNAGTYTVTLSTPYEEAGTGVYIGSACTKENYIVVDPAGTISEAEAQAILGTQSDAMDYYTTLLEEGSGAAAEAVVAWLLSQPLVREAAVTESGDVSILYTCGLPAGIHVCSGTDPETLPASTPRRDIADAPYKGIAPDQTAARSSAGGKRAIVLLPFDAQLGRPCGLDTLISNLVSIGYEVEGPVVGGAVTIDRLMSIANYDFVYVSTHGFAWKDSQHGEGVALTSGEATTLESFLLLALATDMRGLFLSSIPGEGMYVGLTDRFFDDYDYNIYFYY